MLFLYSEEAITICILHIMNILIENLKILVYNDVSWQSPERTRYLIENIFRTVYNKIKFTLVKNKQPNKKVGKRPT